jgi:tripartite-type tricarboxylate transporter receptor subunit TctC
MKSIHSTLSRRFVLRSLAALTTVVIAAAVATPAQAQADGPWPTRPITWVVPFTPGGSTDVIGRTIGQKLADVLGLQPVVG